MKAICNSKELAPGLQLLGNIAVPTAHRPILGGIRLSLNKDILEMSATDLEVGMRWRSDVVEAKKIGEVVLPGDRLRGLLKDWPEDDKLNISSTNGKCSIKGRGGDFSLHTFPADEFPTMPVPKGKPSCTLGWKSVVRLTQQTAFACATERLRHTMTGVLFALDKDKILMVGTDGKRMGISEASIPGNNSTFSVIVPQKAIYHLGKVAWHTEEDVNFYVHNNHILAESGNVSFYSQLIEGQYPNYQEAIPKDKKGVFVVESQELADAVRRVLFLTTEERHVIQLKLGDKILVCADTAEIGDGEVGIGGSYEGPTVEIGLNPSLLLDVLKVVDGSITLEVTNPQTAVVLRHGDNYTYVIMPIRLSE